VYQRGSLLDGLAMYLSCDTKKFRDNESTHILHNFERPPIGGSFPLPPWRRHWALFRSACTCRTVILALSSEALGGASGLEHVVVGVGRQLVEVALRHVAVARVAHHVYRQTRPHGTWGEAMTSHNVTIRSPFRGYNTV